MSHPLFKDPEALGAQLVQLVTLAMQEGGETRQVTRLKEARRKERLSSAQAATAKRLKINRLQDEVKRLKKQVELLSRPATVGADGTITIPGRVFTEAPTTGLREDEDIHASRLGYHQQVANDGSDVELGTMAYSVPSKAPGAPLGTLVTKATTGNQVTDARSEALQNVLDAKLEAYP